MESLSHLLQFHHHRLPLRFSLNRHRSSTPIPVSSLSFSASLLYPSSSSSSESKPIRASPPSSSDLLLRNSKVSPLQPPNPLYSQILKTACLAIASAALVLTRLQHRSAIAATLYPTKVPILKSLRNTVEEESYGELLLRIDKCEAQKKVAGKRLRENPKDIEALKSMVDAMMVIEGQVLSNKVFKFIDTLIELEPQNLDWVILKANAFKQAREFESAEEGFEMVLDIEPLNIEAYYGLLGMAVLPDGCGSVKYVVKRVEKVVKRLKKDGRREDARNFRFLIVEGLTADKNFKNALKLCQELEREDSNDCRPHMYQHIIYTLLKDDIQAYIALKIYKGLVEKDSSFVEEK